MIMNDIEELYNQTIIVTKDNEYECPVCGKIAKKIQTIETHMEKMDCFSYRDVFEDTETEKRAFRLYNNNFSKQDGVRKLPINVFRKSPIYSQCVKFVTFCTVHEIHKPEFYYEYISEQNTHRPLNYVLKVALDEKNVKLYRKFLLMNHVLIDNKFMNTNMDHLSTDPLFLTRSIEKAHISFEQVLNNEELTQVMVDLPFDYAERLETLYGEV